MPIRSVSIPCEFIKSSAWLCGSTVLKSDCRKIILEGAEELLSSQTSSEPCSTDPENATYCTSEYANYKVRIRCILMNVYS